jgi:uncharacterized protein (TIGR00251 family)
MKSTLVVKVRTRASNPGIEKIGEREYQVSVKAAPTKGKANAEVIQLLASYLNIPRSCLTIVRGQTSRHKLIAFDL